MSDSTTYKIQDSPFYNFLTGEWVSLSAKLDSIEMEETDFVLYVLWVIDSLRDSDSRPGLLKDPWAVIRMAIREHLRAQGYTKGKEDIDYLTGAVCGHALYCWGFVLTDAANDSQTNRESFMVFEHNLGAHWKNVQGLLNSIKCESASELRQWMISYVNGELFFTIPWAAGWDTDIISGEDQALVAISNRRTQGQTIVNFPDGVKIGQMNFTGDTQIGTLVGKADKVNTNNGE